LVFRDEEMDVEEPLDTSIVGQSLLKQPKKTVADTVTESAEGFHGFADSEVPRYGFDDRYFTNVDLKTPFKASGSHALFHSFSYNPFDLFFSINSFVCICLDLPLLDTDPK
jgi:hypothetical protein